MSPDHADHAGISLAEILGTLRRNFLWILVCAAVASGVTWWWVSKEIQLYQGSALIRLIDARGALTSGVAGGDQPRPLGGDVDPIRSEIMVLTGRSVVGEVVSELGLRVYDPVTLSAPTFLSDVGVYLEPEDGATLSLRISGPTVTAVLAGPAGQIGQPVSGEVGDRFQMEGVAFTLSAVPIEPERALYVLTRDQAVDVVAATASARPRPGTDGIDVSYTSPDPERAVAVVNALVSTYQEANARTGQLQATRRRIFLEEQLRQQDSATLAAQSDLAEFRSDRQAYTSREAIQQQQSEARAVEAERSDLEAERAIYIDLIQNLQAGTVGSGEMAAVGSTESLRSNPVVSRLYGQWADFTSTRDSMTLGSGARAPTHPDVVRVDSLIISTEARLAQALMSQLAVLDGRIEGLGARSADATTALGQLPDTEAEEARLVRRVETMQNMSDQLRSEYQRARVDEAVEGGQVEIVNLASRAFPVPQQSGFKVLLGLLIGVTLGSAIGMFREGLDRSLTREEDVEAALGVPNLAIIPKIKSTKKFHAALKPRWVSAGNGRAALPPSTGGSKATGVVQYSGNSLARPPAVIEAYRALRTNLILAPSIESVRTLVVTSAAPGEGKSLTVANLGAAFAQQGFTVLLLDTDLRRPDLARMFGVPSKPGVTELLKGEAGVSKAIQKTGVERLDVISAGTVTDESSELLGGPQIDGLIRRLQEDYDLIILDTPPSLATPDAALLSAVTDSVLVVVRAGKTDRQAAERVMEHLSNVGAHVIGSVLNDPEGVVPRFGGYYGYEYSASSK